MISKGKWALKRQKALKLQKSQSPAVAQPPTLSQNHRLFLAFLAIWPVPRSSRFFKYQRQVKGGCSEAFLKCSLPPSQEPSLVACLQLLSCPVSPSSELPGVRALERLNFRLLCSLWCGKQWDNWKQLLNVTVTLHLASGGKPKLASDDI